MIQEYLQAADKTEFMKGRLGTTGDEMIGRPCVTGGFAGIGNWACKGNVRGARGGAIGSCCESVTHCNLPSIPTSQFLGWSFT